MKQLFILRPVQSRLLLLLLLVHLCLGTAWAQQGSIQKSAANSSYAQLVAQIGHEEAVDGIAFSPDGQFLLTASSDAAVLWEVATGQELRRFLGRLTQLEPFSADARFLMTAYEQYTGYGDFSNGWFTTQDEHLFDVTTGREINFNVTAPDSRGFWALVISPDNRLVATADHRDDTVRIWDVTTRRQLKQFKAFTKKHEGKGIGFTKDGRFLLTTIEDEQESLVQLWEPTTGQEVQRFAGKIIRESPDSRYLITQAGRVGHLWERETGREIKLLSPSPNSENLHGRAKTSNATVHRRQNPGLDLLLGSVDVLQDGDGEWQAVFSSDSSLVAISPGAQDEARMVRVFESVSGKELHSFAGSSPAFSPDGRYLITLTGTKPPQQSFRNDTARVWDIKTGAELRRFPADAAKFSPDSRFVVTLNPNQYEKNQTPARLWELSTGAEVLRFEGYPNGVQVARFSPDSRLVATTGGYEPTVRLWDIATRREVRRFAGNFLSGNFEVSRDNRFMMTKTSRTETQEGAGGEDKYALHSSVQLWDLGAGQEMRRFESKVADEAFAARETEATFSPDGRSFVINEAETTSLRDTTTGQELRRFKGINPLFVPGGRLLTTNDKTYMYLWNVATGQEVRRFQSQQTGDDGPSGDEHFVAFSPNGRYGMTMGNRAGVTVFTSTNPGLWDLTTGKRLHSWDAGTMHDLATFAPDSRSVLMGTGLAGDGAGVGEVCLYSVPAGTELRCFTGRKPGTTEEVFYGTTALQFSPDGRFVLAGSTGGTSRLWNARTGNPAHSFLGDNARFSPDGRFVLTSSKNNARLWDAATGKELHRFEHTSRVGAIDFLQNGRIALTASGDSSLRLWDTATGLELCRLVSFKSGDWVVITPDGRFDTNNLDEIKGLHWVTSDAPFTTLPLEIFMRQYYEPRLLPRIIAGEKFNALPSLAELNRVQPLVKIKEISKPDEQNRVSVKVEVGRAKSETQRDAKGNFLETDVYDLRLFRDGQLVGYAPKEGREVKLDAETGKAVITFTDIRLPQKPDVRQVEFSAYAFNVAQVKSATDRKTFELPKNLPPRKGRAYLITIGVNAYENETFDLSFAANDARRLQRVVSDRLTKTGQYHARDIVQVQLISDYSLSGARRVVTENTATKRNFQTVLELLSGRAVDPQLLKAIPGADRIERARPEDLVFISFSSHGYAVPDGDFYFILSDTGPGTEKVATPELLSRAVSSDELSLWLRDVDAGEMVLVVDACQSTAVVERQGFKPGPMDSRGLGQLSYDKSMRILTATQADNVALESSEAQQGLLTYALVQDGLEAGRADFKPRDRQITLSEWLAYGVERVPKLYEEMIQGRLRNAGKGTQGAVSLLVLPDNDNDAKSRAARPSGRQPTAAPPEKIQQPSLFDFARKRRDLVLVKN
ncbi:MAG TPA: caspase family protein [Pyrinomonadaceae bacterium]|jgi:WD40 repeat protein/uncharacterized caspase-like protein